MFRRLITFLLGALRLEVTGGDLGAFLGRAAAADMTLWNLSRQGDRIWASLGLPDFWRLRAVRQGTGCRVRIRGRHGFPFLVGRLKRRPVWVAGLVGATCLLLWASAHVWLLDVRITGPQFLDARAVRVVAEEAGLKPGTWKRSIDTRAVAAKIRGRISEASWVVIRLTGTRAVIEVVENAAQKAPPASSCIHLYAKKDAVVEQVVPFQGEAVVKPGDIVKKGDLLVECVLRYYPGGRPSIYPGSPKPPREGIAHTTVALAQVKGRVLYREYREVPLYRDVPVRTGDSVQSWVLNWQGAPILRLGAVQAPFQHLEEEVKRLALPAWRNWTPPVELVIRTAHEVTRQREPLPLPEILKEAEEGFRARLSWMLGPTDQLLSPLKAEVVEQGKDWAGVRVVAETLEEIGYPQEGTPPAAPPPPTQP
jgi:similar to stage IV sporulation protein